MTVKEAPWEKRNLGVNAIEFYLDETDTPDKVQTLQADYQEFDYQVAYLPAGRMDLFQAMAGQGFDFSEMRFFISASLRNHTLPKLFDRYIDGMEYHPADEKEQEQIYAAIQNGLFDSDKISLDTRFGAEKAGRRYALWCQDEIQKHTGFPYIVAQFGRRIGFFVLKENGHKTGDSFLAGLFDRKADGGLGFSVLYYPMYEAKRRGMRKIESGVSSNNPSSLRLHLALGYEIETLSYVMVKHL